MKSENECCSRTKRGTETQIIVIKLFREKKMDRKLASENALSSFLPFSPKLSGCLRFNNNLARFRLWT